MIQLLSFSTLKMIWLCPCNHESLILQVNTECETGSVNMFLKDAVQDDLHRISTEYFFLLRR